MAIQPLGGKVSALGHFVGRVLAPAGLVLTCAVPAGAQIYTWVDANGNLVLADKRPAPGVSLRTFPVPRAGGIHATREVPADRTGAYDDLILEHAQRQGIRPSLVRAVIQVESAFNPDARSPKGAAGLMQLMPATARMLGVDPTRPEENIEGGVRYLSSLLTMFGGIELALVAYNGGPEFARRYARGETALYGETRSYVRQVLALVHTPR